MKPTTIVRRLSRALGGMRFRRPVVCVYDPMGYAWANVREYLERYARRRPRALLLGMNPGPWGMVQTGVPFGEVAAVRDWLGISNRVKKPPVEHPARPILGMDCPRSEVSGRRLWGWARERFGTPERFAETLFVWNYCPLAFLEESGRNRTPDKLPAREREALFGPCDEALRNMVEWLEPERVIGVGAFAEARAESALVGLGIPTGRVLHPSPASPLANRGWAARAEEQLIRQGVPLPSGGRAGRSRKG